MLNHITAVWISIRHLTKLTGHGETDTNLRQNHALDFYPSARYRKNVNSAVLTYGCRCYIEIRGVCYICRGKCVSTVRVWERSARKSDWSLSHSGNTVLGNLAQNFACTGPSRGKQLGLNIPLAWFCTGNFTCLYRRLWALRLVIPNILRNFFVEAKQQLCILSLVVEYTISHCSRL